MQIIVEIPGTIYQFGDAPRATQIYGQLELLGLAEGGVQHVIQPCPLKVRRANGLRFITGQ